MKRILYTVLGLAVLIGIYFMYIKYSCEKFEREQKEWIANLKHTASHNVSIIEAAIPMDNSNRTLAVYLPENYEEDTVAYPVFYFLDGQSLFDTKIMIGEEWQVDEVMDSLGQANQKAIVVGIYNSDKRDSEYQPNFESDQFNPVFTGKEHSEWIVNTVKPWVDTTYRTKPSAASTIIGGASFGGLMSYYMLTEYPDVFGGAIILSPSFWVNEKTMELDRKVSDLEQKYIYMSAGEKEGSIKKDAKKLNRILSERGLKENYRFEIEENEIHSNLAWRKMIKKSIPWVLKRINSNSF